MLSPKKKFRQILFKYLVIFLAITFFSNGCVQNKPKAAELSKEERVWVDKFFRDIFVRDHAIYTLWGSKPMTLISIENYTREEVMEIYNSMSKEERKKCTIIKEEYNLPVNWEKWKKISSRFPLKRYLLVENKWSEFPTSTYVFFIDILKTALVIQENYDIFKNLAGYDFNPMEVVLEMQEKEITEFWSKTLNSMTWGILFGFGKENSFPFHWKYFDSTDKTEDFLSELSSSYNKLDKGGVIKNNVKHLTIPDFVIFDEPNETVEKYHRERKRIQRMYRGKNFVDLTMERLTRG